MRILVAPQEFKGSLSSTEAAQAIARGVRAALPDAELDLAPLADGGSGTVEAFLSAAGGTRRVTRVAGPLGAPVDAAWAVLPDGTTAVIELAAASGLTLLDADKLDPRRATTWGTGELVRAALGSGCRRVWVGAGGSATHDLGAGAAAALGVRFLDGGGLPLTPEPRNLTRAERIELAGLDPRLAGAELKILTDVRNPLLGPEGAARVYGPQKGADFDIVEELEHTGEHLATLVKAQLGKDLAFQPGAGAAGGFAYGMSAFCGATLSSGFDAINELYGLFARITAADWVLTGEGRLDTQSAYFKGPFALGRLAKMQNKPAVVFAGSVAAASGSAKGAFQHVITVTPPGMTSQQIKERAAELLERAAEAWARGVAARLLV